MYHFNALIGMNRSDLTETVIALLPDPGTADVVRERLTPDLTGRGGNPGPFIRLRIKPLDLEKQQVAALVESWGYADGLEGLTRPTAQLIETCFRKFYLRGWKAGQHVAKGTGLLSEGGPDAERLNPPHGPFPG